MMKAIVIKRYGSPDVLRLADVVTPSPNPGEVLIRVRASSINSADDRLMRARPFLVRFMSKGLFRPQNPIPGLDLAGTVAAVGADVSRFKLGDKVYGDISKSRSGAYAEYVCVAEGSPITAKPETMTFRQAAAVPVAGLTALQALVNHAQVKRGDHVLVNGASGGVGTFTVMLAKAFGAEVTGVCSARNHDFIRSIGADHIVDYRKQPVHTLARRFDVIIDIAANLKTRDYRRLLQKGGRGILVGFSTMPHMLGVMLKGKRLFNRFGLTVKPMGNACASIQDLDTLSHMMDTGQITPAIDRAYPLEKTADAMRYFENEHPRGKVIIEV